MSKKSFGLVVVLAVALVGGCAGIGATHMATAQASESSNSANAITVFVDATYGFRKDHMARKLTKSHAEYAVKGYHFAQMVGYNENGDLQGFFVTYVRN